MRLRLQHARHVGSGDRICYHGVTDIFREPKPAAGFYKSQCDPSDEIVLEPAFHGLAATHRSDFSKAMVCSNCEHLKFYIDDKLIAEVDPDRTQFAHLRYAPFVLEMGELFHKWGNLRIERYIGGKQVIENRMSGRGVDAKFLLLPDDNELAADGADATRVVLRVTDEFGAVKPFAHDSIRLELDGPAEIIGDNPFSLIGGRGAIWIRALEQPGAVWLKAIYPSWARSKSNSESSLRPTRWFILLEGELR